MNFSFIKKYKKILIIEPYFGNILERRVKKMIKKIQHTYYKLSRNNYPQIWKQVRSR